MLMKKFRATEAVTILEQGILVAVLGAAFREAACTSDKFLDTNVVAMAGIGG